MAADMYHVTVQRPEGAEEDQHHVPDHLLLLLLSRALLLLLQLLLLLRLPRSETLQPGAAAVCQPTEGNYKWIISFDRPRYRLSSDQSTELSGRWAWTSLNSGCGAWDVVNITDREHDQQIVQEVTDFLIQKVDLMFSHSLTSEQTNSVQHIILHFQSQSPIYNQQYSGNGVAPAFVKVKHTSSTLTCVCYTLLA